MNNSTEYEAGAAIMERIWGVAPAPGALPADYHAHFVVEHLYGRVWSRPQLPLTLRSLITVVATIACGREHEAMIHIHGARNLGVSRQTLEEVMTHLGHYVGWPLAIMGLKIIAQAFTDGPVAKSSAGIPDMLSEVRDGGST